jgi:hypothetical protein
VKTRLFFSLVVTYVDTSSSRLSLLRDEAGTVPDSSAPDILHELDDRRTMVVRIVLGFEGTPVLVWTGGMFRPDVFSFLAGGEASGRMTLLADRLGRRCHDCPLGCVTDVLPGVRWDDCPSATLGLDVLSQQSALALPTLYCVVHTHFPVVPHQSRSCHWPRS